MTTEIKREFPAEHARLGPSSAERWMACPGSAALIEGLPKGPETIYQHEGNMAHALAEYSLRTLTPPISADVVYGGEPIPDEMREAVQQFYEVVLSTGRTGTEEHRGHHFTLLVEQRVDLAPLNPPEPMYGTADAIVIADDTLDVFDLKYGRGVTVLSTSPQIRIYALGAVLAAFLREHEEGEDLGGPTEILSRALRRFRRIRVHIVQPRQGGAVRSEQVFGDEEEGYEDATVAISAVDLREFAAALMMAAERAHTPGAPLVAGEQCRFCDAKAFCPALKSYAMVAAQSDFDVAPVQGPPPVETLSIAQAAEYLTKVPVLTAWATALKERIEAALNAGEEVPGFKLVEKRARRHWIKSDDETAGEITRLTSLGSEIWEEPTLKSPAQIEKLTGKKKFPGELVIKRSTGTTVAPDSDPRPAVGRLSAQAEFAGYLPAGSTDEAMQKEDV